MNHEWENQTLLHRNRLPGRASYIAYDSLEKALAMRQETSDYFLSLDGRWDFHLAPSPLVTPDGWTEEGFVPGESWTKLDVPGCWQMQGFGTPVYSASPYLFATDPPFVAEMNDTGCYRRTFVLPKAMEGGHVTLRFEGVGSMFYAYLNGKEVGISKGPHLAAEFDVTDLVRPGKNLLCVKVLRFSDGSYLEIQDMYHMSGIFRSVELLGWSKDASPSDVYIRTDDKGNVDLAVTAASPLNFVAAIYDADGNEVLRGAKGETHLSVPSPKLWSAEAPYLYTLVLECGGRFIPFRIGLRSVAIKDGQLLVNGMAIKAKGVNHHDTNTDLGWAVSREALEADVLLMKRHNINFVRTSHYPSHPYFYDLCDRYGIYVLDEADIECHGMGITDLSQLSTDPTWEAAYVDRGVRTVLRDRNHPCVVIWSMGNESGFGDNFRAVSRAMRELDDRPIHYCEARNRPKFDMEELRKDPEKMYAARQAMMHAPWDPCVDMGSAMYMAPTMLDEEGARTDETIPFILCEYAHSMGNSPGSLKEYWEVIYKHPRLLGACVWEWQDHGIRKFTADGKQYYGGGFDLDMPYKRDGINGNFCNDGLISPEKVPHPGLLELKKAIQPLYITLESTAPLRVKIESRYQFLSGETVGHWELVQDGRAIAQGALCIDDLAPATSKVYDIPAAVPASGESLLNLSFRLKESTLWADAGHEIAAEQFVLGKRETPAAPAAGGTLAVERGAAELKVTGADFALKFDLLKGSIVEWTKAGEQLIALPLRQNFWRAPTDNDVGIVGPMNPGAANNWKDNGLDRLVPRNIEDAAVEQSDDRVIVRFKQRWGANPFPPVLDTDTTFTVYPDGSVDVAIGYNELKTPYINEQFWWPRLGVTVGITDSHSRILWHGRGPGENYSDRCLSTPIGWYEKRVCDLHTSYSRMQENGARTDNRSMQALDNRGRGIIVTALDETFTFTAHDYTDAALTAAWHEYQLERAGCTVLDIDMVQSGLGSNSCGPQPMEQYKPTLTGKHPVFAFRIKAI